MGWLGLPVLLVAAFAVGSMSVFFDVAYQASVTRLVERRQLVQGNSALEGSRSAAQVSGVGLGGLLATVLPAPVAIASSVPLFALSSLSIHQIRHEPAPVRPQRHRRVWRQVHEGLRFVVGNGSGPCWHLGNPSNHHRKHQEQRHDRKIIFSPEHPHIISQ